jgi:hypothetical protein
LPPSTAAAAAGLRCQAIHTEHSLYIAERTHKAVYIYCEISMGYGTPRTTLVYRFASEKLNPAKLVDPFYIAKSDISKISNLKGPF